MVFQVNMKTPSHAVIRYSFVAGIYKLCWFLHSDGGLHGLDRIAVVSFEKVRGLGFREIELVNL